MTDLSPQFGDVGGSPLGRRVVGSYASYAEAQRAVDLLSDQGFPVERVSIVGHDLEYVEQVTGRMTTARAALNGTAQGALLGLLFALLLGLFFTVAAAYIALLLFGVVAGAVLGAIIGAILHAAVGGERDFSGVGAMRANRYDVMADDEVADDASRLLEVAPPATASTASSAGFSGAAAEGHSPPARDVPPTGGGAVPRDPETPSGP